jgi:CRP-like cAMP-binding protein
MPTEHSSRLFREIFLAGFMSGLPAENVKWAAAKLAPNMTDVHLRAGEVLYRQGEPPEAHFFLVSGAIRLEAEGLAPWLMEERSLIGTIDITLGRPRKRNAIAERDSFLLRMPAADWLGMLEDNFELTLRAVQGVIDFVDKTRAELGTASSRDVTAGTIETETTESPAGGSMLPDGPLGFLDRLLVLRSLPQLATAGAQALSDLAEVAHESVHEPDVVLAAGRTTSDAIYLVLGGELTLETRSGDTKTTESFGPGAMVLGPRGATPQRVGYEARVTEKARILELPREDFYDVMEEHFGMARSMLKWLVGQRETLLDEKERRAAAAKG